ncbi:TRAP transporter small permease subunit [uncultured Roseibium sp.]|uniref:TRAP transporter small permease subunit n=1 Tax=uncultured Roseibium sp. TaxID=1936171 RepID=UPI00261DA4EA|nr:TRAP transporter small permease [uncultured Roseibium sp.]
MSDDIAVENDDAFVPKFSEAPFGALLGTVAAVMSSIGTLGIGALMVLIVADVLGRNFFNAPITGVAEIAGRTVVAIVFLQIAAAILQKRLTRADFLIRRLNGRSPRTAAMIEMIFALTGVIVLVAILWASWPKFADAWQTSEFFGVQGVFTIPTWPFRGITILGSAVAALAALYRAQDEARRFRRLA